MNWKRKVLSLYKRLVIGLITLLTALSLSACSGGSYSMSFGSINAYGNSISGSYDTFNGNYYKQAQFKQGESVDFQVSLNTESGEFSAELIDSSGITVTKLDKDKVVKIAKTGTYKIQVDGTRHKGNFAISWHDVTN